jgi:hypothetical protein
LIAARFRSADLSLLPQMDFDTSREKLPAFVPFAMPPVMFLCPYLTQLAWLAQLQVMSAHRYPPTRGWL